MRVGESDPELRRVYLAIFLDDGVTPATDADVSPPVGSLQTTINGATPATSGGPLVGDGAGEYYYEFSALEVAAAGFVATKFERVGYQTVWVTAEVGNLFTVGETDVTLLRLPIVIRDDSSPPALVTSAATVTSPSQLQTALSSVSFGDAAGTLHFVSEGLHYYQGTAGDVTVEGTLIVRFQKSGYQTESAWTTVSSLDVVTPASLLSISPTPLTEPGDSGGFPISPAALDATPVTIVIDDAVDNLDRILVTFTVDGVEEVAFYSGLLRGRYAPRSSRATVGQSITLTILRVGGWSKTAGQMTLVIEGVTPDTFSLLLPTVVGDGVNPRTPVVSPTALDHTAALLNRLPQQFKPRAKIEAMVRILCRPLQDLENLIVEILSQYGLNNSTGARLRQLAKLVNQSTSGLTDDQIQRLTRAAIAANRSSGTTQELIAIVRLVIDSPTTDVSVETRRIASVVVALTDHTTSLDVAATLIRFLRRAKGAAIRIRLFFQQTDPAFRFDSGPGFDQGHFRSTLE